MGTEEVFSLFEGFLDDENPTLGSSRRSSKETKLPSHASSRPWPIQPHQNSNKVEHFFLKHPLARSCCDEGAPRHVTSVKIQGIPKQTPRDCLSRV